MKKQAMAGGTATIGRNSHRQSLVFGLTALTMIALGGSVYLRPPSARGDISLSELYRRTMNISAHIVQPATNLTLVATPLNYARMGQRVRRAWNIEMTDDEGDYIGETVWTADTGELISTNWQRVPSNQTRPITNSEVHEIAAAYMMELKRSETPAWRTMNRTVHRAKQWTVWCDNGSERFRLRLDEQGRLLAADRQRTAG